MSLIDYVFIIRMWEIPGAGFHTDVGLSDCIFHSYARFLQADSG